ncbi:RluA family pseudouridine synthase [Haematospirillum sp. H1815]|uniref:RluA family pseudouridine synthase n=1 Tax=Haematospirillum sp. H1815 TaxID=2723108 RepID=UPI00143BAAE3|nr:RluA family pseudouridine synthase [Haematospirillum sp. H1815]NKD76364.1 RluA family pseudouridine synthase [Haematospirillum sp. H1815]
MTQPPRHPNSPEPSSYEDEDTCSEDLESGPTTLLVSLEDAGERLDRWLAASHLDLSRSRIKSLILKGQIQVNGQTITDPSLRVKHDQSVTVAVPETAPAIPVPQDIPLAIAFEDDHLVVINKAAGMVVHPGAGVPDGTLVNALLHHCGESLSGIGGIRRPGIVHRLDKDTSGLIVVAKHDQAHHHLAKQFSSRTIERTYRAIVWGVPTPASGDITGNIGRSGHNRQKMAIVRQGGKPALTHYRTLTRLCNERAALVECRLATGRTHQIRVHMNAVGHPLIGDPVYGSPRSIGKDDENARAAVTNFRRQALHARTLGFEHPTTGVFMRFEVVLPEDMQALLLALGGDANFF